MKLEVDADLVIPNQDLSLKENAIAPWTPISSQYYPQLLEAVCTHYGIDMDVPVKDLPKHQLDKVLYGSGDDLIYFRYENDFGQIREGEINLKAYCATLKDVTRRQARISSVSRWSNICPKRLVRLVKGIG